MIIAPQAHGSKIQVSSPVYSWELDAETDLFSLYDSEKQLSGRQHETRLACQNQCLDLCLQQFRHARYGTMGSVLHSQLVRLAGNIYPRPDDLDGAEPGRGVLNPGNLKTQLQHHLLSHCCAGLAA